MPSETDSAYVEIQARLDAVETKLAALQSNQSTRAPRRWQRMLTLENARNLVFIFGLPVTIVLAFQAFDEQILSARENREQGIKNRAIDRLDQLQEINAELYRLQSQGDGNVAFAIIEAKRGQIARLTDSVYTAWQAYPDMLGRFDLNALAEALLVQERTGEALEVALAVDTTGLSAISQIDQQILLARIQFALGAAHDMEAARNHLRKAVPMLENIERQSQMLQMMEKITTVRLSNEFWRGTACANLMPMAETLAEIQAENIAAGAYEDAFGTTITLQGVRYKCEAGDQ